MTAWHRGAVTCLALLAALLSGGAAGAQNLVTNGDFEGSWLAAPAGLGDWVGEGWTAYTAPLPATINSASGDPAMWSMPVNNGQPDPGVNNYQRIIGGAIRTSNFRGGVVQAVATSAGTAYDLTLIAKLVRSTITNQTILAQGALGIDLTGQTSNALAPTINWLSFQEMDSWSQYGARFTATGSRTSIWVRASIGDATATVTCDVDDVVVEPAGTTGLISITEGPTATQVSDTTFRIDWVTDVASTSAVEYSLNAPNSDAGLSYDGAAQTPGSTTAHSVLVSGLEPDSVYHFRVESAATGYKTVYSLDKTFRTPPPALAVFTNGSFEEIEGSGAERLATGWHSFPVVGGGDGGDASGYIGPYPSNGAIRWLNLLKAQNGSYFAGAGGSYDRKQGGFFQRIQAVPGMTYRVDAQIATYANGGAPWDCQVWVGIDPKGGVDPGPEPDPNSLNPKAPWIVWAPGDAHGSNTFPVTWIPVSVETVAESNVITVFVRFQQKWQLQFNITAVDNVTVFGPPPQTIPVESIGAAKAQSDYTMVETTDGAIVTLVPVTESGFFYVQDEDGTAGIRVESGAAVNVGDKVQVKGILRTLETGERVLRDTTVTSAGTGSTKIRHMGSRGVGGPRFVGNDGQPVQAGLLTEGLLVRAYGRVTKMDFFSGYFLLDDGSGVDAGDAEGMKGLKVTHSEAYPMPGDLVSIVGVVTSEVVNGKTIRVIRGRDYTIPSDFQQLAP